LLLVEQRRIERLDSEWLVDGVLIRAVGDLELVDGAAQIQLNRVLGLRRVET